MTNRADGERLEGFRQVEPLQRQLREAIADRARAQHELDRFLDLSRDLLCIAGADGRFKRVNRAFETSLGYTRQELVDRYFLDFVHADDREATLAVFVNVRRGEGVLRFENRYVRKDGSTCWLSWTATPLVDEGVIYALARDVTEARDADAALRRSETRMRELFVATVSHELRTPLTSIHGSLGLLAAGVMGELNEDVARVVSVAERNSTRLVNLINDVLDFERLERGKVELNLRPAPLLAILQRSVESVAGTVEQERVTVEMHPVDAVVFGDEKRLIQVLVNFLSIAIMDSHPGGVVTVDASVAEAAVEVRVRARGRRNEASGGLGLAICRSIIHKHGGEIGVDNADGEGSSFWFRVPAVQLHSREVPH